MTFFDYPGESPATTVTESLLADASSQDWEDLLAVTRSRDLQVGELLFAPGSSDGALYLVLGGALEVLAPGRRDSWKRVGLVSTGMVLGELSFLDGQPATTLARATEPTRIAELSHEAYAELAGRRPELAALLAMDLGRILAGRLRAQEGAH